MDNGLEGEARSPVVIHGIHHDLVFRGNRIGFTKSSKKPLPAIQTNSKSKRLDATQNEFENVIQAVKVED